jgi:hypothetical protein
MPHRRFRAPERNGEVLAVPGFAEVPGLVEANRRRLDRADVVIGGVPLRELRALARREVLEAAREYTEGSVQSPPVATGGLSADSPLLIAGHQPELSHPGVWVKHFALNGLARKLGGTPLNLVVDNDTLKSTSLRFPVFREGDPDSVHLESATFDKLDGETPYEDRPVLDPELFETFPERTVPLWENWGYVPLLWRAWREVTYQTGSIGERFAAARRLPERAWGCHNLELPVSRLSQTEAFARFAAHLLHDLPRFREVYNAAIREYRRVNGVRSANHPAPELREKDGYLEAPLWRCDRIGHRRQPAWGSGRSGGLTFEATLSGIRHPPAGRVRFRPRALTLTLFARVCLGDFFIHGIGGGKYDEVTDAIIRGYFGIEPPAYQVLSATLHLPLPGFPADENALRAGKRHVRELTWNPQRYLPPAVATRPEFDEILDSWEQAAMHEPPYAEHAARRARYAALRRVNERLRPLVADQLAEAQRWLARARAEARANAVLRHRDYAWVLYPEETLRPFLQRFLDQ